MVLHVSLLESKDLSLLEAITDLADRYAVFCEPAKLDWEAMLIEKSSKVHVNISPNDSAHACCWSGNLDLWNHFLEKRIDIMVYQLS